MQPSKGVNTYKIDHYNISLTSINQQKCTIIVIDPIERVEFQVKDYDLKNIGTSTLGKAFQKSLLELKLVMKVIKQGQNPIFEILIVVTSQFLKPVEEKITLNKKRSISQAQILTKAVQNLGRKMKQVKQKDGLTPNSLYTSKPIQQKFFNFAHGSFDEMGSVNLKKGKYLLTITFLLKATNQWIYIYINQGQHLMANGGYYVPQTSYYMPHTIRKVYDVKQQQQKVSITSHYGQSYPCYIRNLVITAKKIQ